MNNFKLFFSKHGKSFNIGVCQDQVYIPVPTIRKFNIHIRDCYQNVRTIQTHLIVLLSKAMRPDNIQI